MATKLLADYTRDIVSQFEFSDADLNSHTQEFLRQMGTLHLYLLPQQLARRRFLSCNRTSKRLL